MMMFMELASDVETAKKNLHRRNFRVLSKRLSMQFAHCDNEILQVERC